MTIYGNSSQILINLCPSAGAGDEDEQMVAAWRGYWRLLIIMGLALLVVVVLGGVRAGDDTAGFVTMAMMGNDFSHY